MRSRVAILISAAVFLFSACTRSPSRPEASLSTSPATGGGLDQVFTVQFPDPQDAGHLKQAKFLINQFPDGRQACYVIYDRQANEFALVNDSGSGSTRMTTGAASDLSNSQCRLAGRGSSASVSGNHVTLLLDLHFVPAFSGEKHVYLTSVDASGEDKPFQKAGDWTVASCGHSNAVPSAVSVAPQSGGAASQTFSLTYSSSGDASDLTQVRALINRSADGRSACFVTYSPLTGLIGLAEDDALHFTSVPLSGGQTVANGQCRVSTAGSAVSKVGPTLVWKLAVTFKPSFAGQKNVYLSAKGCSENDTGLLKKGTWNVPHGDE